MEVSYIFENLFTTYVLVGEQNEFELISYIAKVNYN